MKIALIGYGKMGREIEQIALSRGHEISCKIDSKNTIEQHDFANTDVAIEFSKPDLALAHIDFCVTHKIPVVVGTTGWQNHLEEVKRKVETEKASLLYASNFSVGVNIFFEINKKLAKLMAPHADYQLTMTEIHHTQKLDAPSGTAISLANDIIQESAYENWNCVEGNSEITSRELPDFDIIAKRIPDVPGTHAVEYASSIDSIEIKHTAHNRKGFALGAVLAAEWLINKQGVFTMKNILNL